MNPDEAKNELTARLENFQEWLLITGDGKSFALEKDEIELDATRGKLLFGFPSDKGFHSRRVTNYKFETLKIRLDLAKNLGTVRTKIQLVPRSGASETFETIELAQIEKADKIAELIIENQPRAKLIRVSLKQANGRLAQIIFENFPAKQVAAFADVSATLAPEEILTSAIFEFEKLRLRKKISIQKAWILAEKKTARNLRKILAMLKQNWQGKIEVFEIFGAGDARKQIFEPLAHLTTSDLWREKAGGFSATEKLSLSETAQKIIAFAPQEIDAIFTKHGETLRFHGLSFARTRKIAGEEKAWFGTESKRQILNEKTFPEFLELVENLKIYRRFDAPSNRHAFYTLAPEAWLESLLQRNIKQLDANLILSPVHTQFRAGKDKIDLFASRGDGRLVIIELKTSIDREMIFQSLDYWRKIELARRSEKLQMAKIFGDLEIKNEPALIYLVAPLLAFHHDFTFLAQTVAPEIEIYRFDLNENWREDLRVARQAKTVSI